jgi:hypothetical protein
MSNKVIDFDHVRRLLPGKAASGLAREIRATLCPGMILPAPLERLFGWIEANGLYDDTPRRRIGYLFPQSEMKAGWTDSGRPGGTGISFAAEGNADLRYWFRTDDPEVMRRLCVFARTGADGSMAAFWLADDGSQKIVHLGSGSGSTMLCVLADDPVDFLRLIAIGYDEICWGEELTEPPGANREFVVQPNQLFADWVGKTFGVTIPERGSDIVADPVSMDAPASSDPFWQWVAKVTR